jgi:hypothetical protein
MASVTIAQVEQDLMGYLENNLPTGFTTAKVKWPNAKFVTPTGSPWLRATMTTPEVIDRDASNCYKEYQGIFVIDVFYPSEKGSRNALTTADEIAETFNAVAFPYSFSIEADVAIIGEEPGTSWYHVQVSCLYQFGSYTGE